MYKLSALVWIYLVVCLYIEGTCDTYKYISFRVRPAGEVLGVGRGEKPKFFLFAPSAQGTPFLDRLSPGDGLVVASSLVSGQSPQWETREDA